MCKMYSLLYFHIHAILILLIEIYALNVSNTPQEFVS